MKNRAIHLERRRGSEEIPEMTKRWFAGPSFDALDDSDRKNDAKKTVKELEDENDEGGIKSKSEDMLATTATQISIDFSTVVKILLVLFVLLFVLPVLFGSKAHRSGMKKVRNGLGFHEHSGVRATTRARLEYDESLDDRYQNPLEYDNAIEAYARAKQEFEKIEMEISENGKKSINEVVSEDARERYEQSLFKMREAEQKRDFESSMEKKKVEWSGAMKGASCTDKLRHLLESYVEHYSCRFDQKYFGLSPVMNFPVVREDYENAGETQTRALATSSSVADAIKWSPDLSTEEKESDMNKKMSTAGAAVSTWLRFYAEKKKEVLGLRDDGTLTWDALTKTTRIYRVQETFNKPPPPPAAVVVAAPIAIPIPAPRKAAFGVDVAVANKNAFQKMDSDGDGSISVDEVTSAALKGDINLKDGVVEQIVRSKNFKNAALSAEELAMLDLEMKKDVQAKKGIFSHFFGRRRARQLLRKKTSAGGGQGGGGGVWGATPSEIKSPFDAEIFQPESVDEQTGLPILSTKEEPLYFSVNIFASNFPEKVAVLAKESATIMRTLRLPGLTRIFSGNPFKMREASRIADEYTQQGSGYFSSPMGGMISFATAKIAPGNANGYVNVELRQECESANRCGSRWESAPVSTNEGKTEFQPIPDYVIDGKLPDKVSVPSISYKKALEGGYPLLSIVEDADKESFVQAADEALRSQSVPAVIFSNMKSPWAFIEDLKKRYKSGYNIFAVSQGHEHNPRRPVFLPLDDHALAWSFFNEYYPSETSSGITIALIVRDDVSNLNFSEWLAENKIVACDCNLGNCAAATGVKYEEVKYTIENYKPQKTSWEEATKTHQAKTLEWNSYDRLAQRLKESETVDFAKQLEADEKALNAKRELEQAERELKAANAAMAAAKKSSVEKKRSIWSDGWGDFDGFRRRRRLLKKKGKVAAAAAPKHVLALDFAAPAYCDIDDFIDNEDDI
jgi:hypothetical protein